MVKKLRYFVLGKTEILFDGTIKKCQTYIKRTLKEWPNHCVMLLVVECGKK